jgi:hypothetical protein
MQKELSGCEDRYVARQWRLVGMDMGEFNTTEFGILARYLEIQFKLHSVANFSAIC